jgi:D-alanine-D-alanine ligase
MKRLHVLVLMGGPSAERQVSLRSGKAVMEALAAAGARVTPMDVRGDEFDIPADVDVAFIALHGTFGEDGTVQRILEKRGIPYTGSGVEASARAFDKLAAKAAFVAARIPTPAYAAIRRDLTWAPRLRFPLVIKPARQGSSVGVEVVKDRSEFDRACADAWRYDDRLLAEEFIPGRELTVGIFDRRALPVVEIKPHNGFFSYDAKYTAGLTEYLVPAPLDAIVTARAQFFARRAHECLGCRDFSRVDMILSEQGELHVLEVNTIPGFTSTSLVPKAAKAAKMSFQALCVRLVELALSRRPAGAMAVS